MAPLDALPLESEIVVSIGTPKHDRRLSDKILAAFGHAYAEGAVGVAAVLRRALEEAERDLGAASGNRRLVSALVQADLWVEFVEARNAYRCAAADARTGADELEEARAVMMEAYRRWSDA